MVSKILKRINISYALFLRGRLSDRYLLGNLDEVSRNYFAKIVSYKKNIIKIISVGVFLLVVWPMIKGNWTGYKINYQSEDPVQEKSSSTELAETPVMMRPRFFGEDENKNPYIMKAISAVSVSQDKVVLYKIDGELKQKDGSTVKILSDNGDYYTKLRQLNVTNGVVITSTNGYILKTNSAHFDISKNIATGSEDVIIEGVLGDIKSKGFILNVEGDTIEFFGGVELNAITKKDNER